MRERASRRDNEGKQPGTSARRWALALLALAAALLLWSATAGGHALFVGSDPPAQSVLPVAPRQILLRFSEPIDPGASRILVRDRQGRDLSEGSITFPSGDRRQAVQRVKSLLPGEYVVQWIARSAVDGHEQRGAFRFEVAAGPGQVRASTEARGTAAAGLGWAALPIKAIGLLAGLGWFGLSSLSLLLRRSRGWEVQVPGRWVWPAALAVAWLLTWSTGGSSGAAAPAAAPWVRGVSLAALALSAIAALGGAWGRLGPGSQTPLALLALAAFPLTGHAAAGLFPVSSVLLDWVHLLAAGLWVGAVAVVAFAKVTESGSEPLPRWTVARHLTAWVAPAVALVVLTGIFNAETRGVTPPTFPQSAYGRTLGVKLGLVALMAILGFAHARWLGPKLAASAAPGHPGSPRGPWRWALAAEVLVALLVVGASALLSVSPPPPTALPLAPTTAAGLALSEVSGPYLVVVHVSPNQPGDNSLRVEVTASAGAPRPARVRVQRPPETAWVELRPVPVSARSPATFGAAFAGRLTLPAGTQRLNVQVEGADGKTRQARFSLWPVPAPEAAELLKMADEAMSSLASVRVLETLTAGGQTVQREWWYAVPDRVRARTLGTNSAMVVVGQDRWVTENGRCWTRDQLPEAVRVPDFSYTAGATEPHLLGRERVNGQESLLVAFRYGDSDTRFVAWISTANFRFLRLHMTAPDHDMVWVFDRFDQPVSIRPPTNPPGC